MNAMHAVNVFSTFGQEENNFTNGLFALLRISAYEKPVFVKSFLKDLLGITPTGSIESVFCVRVLRGIEYADAELCFGECCLRFETKIASGALPHDEVRRRLKDLKGCSGRLKRVVLLTPDDPKSQYIKQFLSKYKPRVLHLGWKSVYDYLDTAANTGKPSAFTELVKQYLEQIRECVFEQDMAGVITKIAFGDYTEVYPDEYLGEMRRGEWKNWHTPRLYKALDGTGRKLLLYDRERQAITAEVEIKKVKRIPYRRNFPWSNAFATKPKIFRPAIPLKLIRSLPGFENFGKYRKDRSAYRNLTREQYRQLMEIRVGNGEEGHADRTKKGQRNGDRRAYRLDPEPATARPSRGAVPLDGRRNTNLR